MSLRQPVDRARIEQFLAALGEQFQRPRHVFVGRFGQLDVFHFDLYSLALSKVARGRRQDYEDVLLLLKSDRIDWPELDQAYRDVLPRMGQESLRQDPAEFENNFRALASMWREAGGQR